MQFWLSAPRNRERDEGAEDDHVTERNTKKCVRIGDVEHVLVEGPMMTAIAKPRGTMAAARATPNQPTERCTLTLWVRTSAN